MGWNTWLTWRLADNSAGRPEINEEITQMEGSHVSVNTTVVGYTTDITEAAAAVQPKMVEVSSQTADSVRRSSGFIYRTNLDECWIVSTAETVTAEGQYSVRFDNGISIPADLAGFDEQTDLAVFLTHPGFSASALDLGDSDILKQGEYVIGVSSRNAVMQSGAVAFGVISQPMLLFRSGTDGSSSWLADVLTTDCSLSRITEGSVLVNLSGQLAGILSGSLTSANNSIGMTTALSVNEIRLVAEELIDSGTVTRGYLGAAGTDVSGLELYQKSAQNISLEINSGVLITYVEENSPARAAGLMPGDVITAVNDADITDLASLRSVLYSLAPMETVTVTIQRQLAQNTVSLVLE